MNLTEWNARLHGLVIFRALLDDDVIAKFVDLTDRMAAAPQSTGAVCDAAASFEAALFEHTTNFRRIPFRCRPRSRDGLCPAGGCQRSAARLADCTGQ